MYSLQLKRFERLKHGCQTEWSIILEESERFYAASFEELSIEALPVAKKEVWKYSTTVFYFYPFWQISCHYGYSDFFSLFMASRPIPVPCNRCSFALIKPVFALKNIGQNIYFCLPLCGFWFRCHILLIHTIQNKQSVQVYCGATGFGYETASFKILQYVLLNILFPREPNLQSTLTSYIATETIVSRGKQ